MRGGRLAQAKKAAHRLVDRMSPEDRLAIVSYGSNVTVKSASLPVKPANQDRFHRAISQIRRNGSTFLSGGFQKGVELVKAQATEESVNRVILLSDGKANRGVERSAALGRIAESHLQAGVSTTTMGLGLDYDEGVMTTLAEMGAGNHYFVEDEKKLAGMFDREFKGLASVVARDASLVLMTGPQVELLDVRGASHRRAKGGVIIDLGSFYAGQNRDLLVDLAASPAGEGARGIVDVELRYSDVTGSHDEKVTRSASLVSVGTTDTARHAQRNESVMRRVEHFAYVENVQKATEAFDKGDRDRAEQLIEEQKERLDRAADQAVLDREKVAEKKAELDEKKSRMQQAPSSRSASGKRLKKESADQQLDLMKSGSAF
jgi:Ca-activated chloride channel family protein